MSFFCLMTSGMPLSTDQACALAQSSKSKDFFMTECLDGMITTEGKYGMLGPNAKGIIFTATVESDQGKTMVKFLLDVPFVKRIFEEDLPWESTRLGEDETIRGRGRSSQPAKCYSA